METIGKIDREIRPGLLLENAHFSRKIQAKFFANFRLAIRYVHAVVHYAVAEPRKIKEVCKPTQSIISTYFNIFTPIVYDFRFFSYLS